MYRVVRDFADKSDSLFIYHEGDTYPRDGANISEDRIAELLSNENAIGEPLIVAEIEIAQDAPIEDYTNEPLPESVTVVDSFEEEPEEIEKAEDSQEEPEKELEKESEEKPKVKSAKDKK